MAIGSKLKQIIDNRNIKVSELAAMTGLPDQTIYSLISRDSNKVSIDALLSICKALSISVEELYQYDLEDKKKIASSNSMYSLDTHEIDVINAYRENPDMQPAVDRLLLLEKPAKSVIFRAAKSSDNHPPEILETTKDFSKIPPTDIKL